MAVTNEALSAQIKGLDGKVDDFIGTQRQCNEAQRQINEAHQHRLRAIEAEQARHGERLSNLRNVFGGIQLMVGGVLAWLGLR
jgi:hypothetical protein